MSENFAPPRHSAQPYGSVGRMIVFGETLNHAMELVAVETLAKDRVALITVDHLAEVLLHRHASRVFASSEGSRAFPRRQYSDRERKKIHGSFDAMVTLAQVHTEAPWGRDVEPILTTDDATVLRVAHRYRNAIYHEDRHNQTLLSPLTALFAQAVGRAFVAGYPAGNGTSLPQDEAEALTRLGCTIENDSFIANLPMLTYRDAAQQIVDQALASWEVSFEPFREHLAADIGDRALTAGRVLVALSEDGMPEQEIDHALWTSQFWDKHGADAELLRLERARFDRRDDDAAASVFFDHLRELQRTFRPAIEIRSIPRFERRARSLTSAKTIAILLDRYLQLDREIEALGRATGAAADAWEHSADSWVD